jgi:UPF0176 protein
VSLDLTSASTQVVALYRFVRLDDFEALREPLLNFCLERNIKGTLLLAREGINGTVAGSAAAIEALLEYLCTDDRLADLDYKRSYHEERPFLAYEGQIETRDRHDGSG